MMKNLIILMLILILGFNSWGQDLHYADIQTMNLWYNQSLKLDRHADIRMNFREKWVVSKIVLDSSLCSE